MKDNKLQRRKFLKTTALTVGTTMLSSIATAVDKAKTKPVWKKCALHNHTFWSDGQSMPEVAITEFRKRGFDMFVMTEHNVFPDDKEAWIRVYPKATSWPSSITFDEYYRTHNNAYIEKNYGFKKFLRLKTLNELKKQFEIPNKFLIAGGVEITRSADYPDGTRREAHLNLFNIGKNFWIHPKGKDVQNIIKESLDTFKTLKAKSKHPMFAMLNHPFWRVWDVLPVDVLQFPEITHFEICNCGAEDEISELTPDKFWDILLAHRLEKRQGVIFATASDDTHYYGPKRINNLGGVNHGWVMARVNGEFTVDNTMKAIANGDCYPTCGVLLSDIVYDRKSKTLSVEVDAEDGVEYTIEFITTKRGFSHTVGSKDYTPKNKKNVRTLPVYSDDIGNVVKVVKGTKASYKMNFNDLYVRAKITSNKPTKNPKHPYFPKKQCAWTQPLANS